MRLPVLENNSLLLRFLRARCKLFPPDGKFKSVYVKTAAYLFLLFSFLLTVPACKQPTAPDPKPEFSINPLIETVCDEGFKVHLKGAISNAKIFSENQLIPRNVL